MIPQRLRIAAHECGHALSALWLGIGIRHATVYPAGSGDMRYGFTTVWTAPPRALLFTAAAGPAAEITLYGPTPLDPWTHTGDHARQREWAQRAAGWWRSPEPIITGTRDDARRWAHAFQDVIRDAARELATVSRMHAADFDKYVRRMRDMEGKLPFGCPEPWAYNPSYTKGKS